MTMDVVLILLFILTFSAAWRLPFTPKLCLRRLVPTTTPRDDSYFMTLALKQAQKAKRRDEVPVGAVVVDRNGHVLAQTHNLVETYQDASAHAECLAFRKAARRKGTWRLTECTLYSTLEPCVMCYMTAHQFRIQRIVYGANDTRLGALTTASSSNLTHPFHTISLIEGGLYANESSVLLQTFFRQRRGRTK